MGLYDSLLIGGQQTKRKLFISYYHNDDEYYRNRFETLFGNIFINKSVKLGDITTDISTEYVKRLIQSNYLSDTSVLVVLVGAKTYCRKHVDWEISAALSKKVGGYSGLIGSMLPTHPDYGKDKYNAHNIPTRLAENLSSGYAQLYDWTENIESMKQRINDAYNNKNSSNHLIKNNSPQFQKNRCD